MAGTAVGIGFLAKMQQAFLVLPAFGVAYLVAAVPVRTRLVGLAGAVATMVISGGCYLLLVELWPASSRPYIGGSQHDSIMELALGYNGLGRLTGDETGGLGNMNFDVGWGRLLGHSMGAYIAWLIPAAGLLITRRAPRTDPTRAGLILWAGWLVVTAVVFSYANGILHQYYSVALAPAIGAGIGISAVLLWRNRFDVCAAVAMSATVLVTAILAAVLLARRYDWLHWLGTTVATPHSGAIPSVGPPRGHGSFGGPGGPGGGFLDILAAGTGLTALLADGADRFEWTAAVVGSTNATTHGGSTMES